MSCVQWPCHIYYEYSCSCSLSPLSSTCGAIGVSQAKPSRRRGSRKPGSRPNRVRASGQSRAAARSGGLGNHHQPSDCRLGTDTTQHRTKKSLSNDTTASSLFVKHVLRRAFGSVVAFLAWARLLSRSLRFSTSPCRDNDNSQRVTTQL